MYLFKSQYPDLVLNKHLLLFSVLRTVNILLNIFTGSGFSSEFFNELTEHHLYKNKIFYINVKVFIVTFNQINASRWNLYHIVFSYRTGFL